MKTIIIFVSLFLITTYAKADTISACDASKHIGELVTVEGVVGDIHHAASGKAIFINMCGTYPNNGFSVVIFSGDATKFPEIDSLKGKNIDVTGRTKSYQGSPEIILNDPTQLKIK
jgi:DNA/RNA endonuclease YhcR with UshA esterase domain